MAKVLEFKKKEQPTEDRRNPLYVNHRTGKTTGSPHLRDKHTEDFGDRESRIKASLDRINALMAELKKMKLMSHQDRT